MPEDSSPVRRYPRAQVLCPVTLCQEGALERYMATNINEGGMLLLSRTPIKAGPRFRLIFELPNGRIIEADGEICSARPEVGFGVRFTHIEPEHRLSISRAVLSAAIDGAEDEAPPTPEQLERWKQMRSEPRVVMSFEIHVEGRDETGELFTERGRVYDVSRHGVASWVSRPYEIDQEVQLTGPRKRFTAPAVVRNCIREGGHWRVGLRLLAVPDEWVIQ
jgi:hypothetical protein